MPRCIYCLEEFESATKEHIIQDSLGARWESNTIVCNRDQNDFGRTIDLALVEALKPIRNLFGTRGGRGKEAPPLKSIRALSGELFDLESDFRPRLREPLVRMKDLPNGRRGAELIFNGRRQYDWALWRLRQAVPDISIDEDILPSIAETVPLTCDVQISLGFGGQDYFRGMLKSCFNLLAVNYSTVVFEPCFDAVRSFVHKGTGNLQQFIRWTATHDHLDIPNLGPIDQAIFIVSRGSSVEGIVQFFGEIVHLFQLTDSYAGNPIHCGYVVDPSRVARPAETKEPEFSAEAIPIYADQLLKVTSDVLASFKERTTRILRIFHWEREQRRVVEEAFQEVIKPHAGQPFTPELRDQLAARIAERMIELIFGHAGPAQQ